MFFHGHIMPLLTAIFTFIIIVVASNEIAKGFQKLRLPLITGFIIIGVIAGPDMLKMIPREALSRLTFIDDIALAFIAFAAGNELFFKDLEGKMRNILIMTIVQFVFIFLISYFFLMWLSEMIPFMSGKPHIFKIGIAILVATIFTGRSPASAIAVVNELKAKGPFTQTTLGVIIAKDVMVIVVFTVMFSISSNLVNGHPFKLTKIGLLLLELLVSVIIGIIFFHILKKLFSMKMNTFLETLLFLLTGWLLMSSVHFLEAFIEKHFDIPFHIEALLSGIIASVKLTNNTNYRLHLENLIHKVGPFVFVAFFTKVGADIKISILAKYWNIALLLFGIRLLGVIVSSIIGSFAIKERHINKLLSWTPYITQAGVSLGLVTIVANSFPQFGELFETIMVAVIILNLLIGPGLFKWAILSAGEARIKAKHTFDGVKDVVIFGLENLSVHLAKALQKQNWKVKIITCEASEQFLEENKNELKSIELVQMKEQDLSPDKLDKISLKNADAVVLLMSDYRNLSLAEIINKHFGTPTIVARMTDFNIANEMEKLGVLVVQPLTAMTALLENFVRSPYATSLLIGMDEDKVVEDIEVLNTEIHGKALREIHLPLGVLVLSVTRGGESILTHGYTRLRLHDIVTVLGTPEEIEQTRIKLQF